MTGLGSASGEPRYRAGRHGPPVRQLDSMEAPCLPRWVVRMSRHSRESGCFRRSLKTAPFGSVPPPHIKCPSCEKKIYIYKYIFLYTCIYRYAEGPEMLRGAVAARSTERCSRRRSWNTGRMEVPHGRDGASAAHSACLRTEAVCHCRATHASVSLIKFKSKYFWYFGVLCRITL